MRGDVGERITAIGWNKFSHCSTRRTWISPGEEEALEVEYGMKVNWKSALM